MKEKLQQYALVAEIVSAIAIVLSLLFVGMQVRLGSQETAINSAAITATIRDSMLQTDLNILLYAGEHQLLASPTGITFDEDLTPSQSNALIGVLFSEIRSREVYWYQHESGVLDDETYYSFRDSFVSGLKINPRYRVAWDAWVKYSATTPGFVAEINRELESN